MQLWLAFQEMDYRPIPVVNYSEKVMLLSTCGVLEIFRKYDKK
jgi:hypothetical protein